jgi:hypothetical protein
MTTKEKDVKELDGKSQLVQMRLQPKTLERLNNLSKLTDSDNRTQLVSSSIQLTEEIIKSIKQSNAKIYIETPDGKREVIKIVGL